MYPQYPEFKPTPRQGYPKPNIADLMDVYDELTSVGLTLLPKRRKMKVPIPEYWQRDAGTPDYSRQAMYGWQHDDNVCGWCVRTGRVYVVDLDPADIRQSGAIPELLYDDIQAMSESAFVLSSPSGGVHIYYRIPDEWDVLPNTKLFPGVDGRGEGGQVVTIGGYNRYEGEIAQKKGVPEGHYATYRKLEFGIYDSIPEMSKALYDHIKGGMHKTGDKRPVSIQAQEYQKTEQANQRVIAHRKQPLEVRRWVVIEALSYILKDWGSKNYYDDWLPLWMSAWDGCNDVAVLEYILEHPDVYWKHGQIDKEQFIRTWENHRPRDEGYTVATLFWLARIHGWLQSTGVEISVFETIAVKRISDWFAAQETLPQRLLLVSQTGSGKTFSYIAAWKALGQPKSVVIVPTTKLAKELATTLRKADLPVTLYVDGTERLGAQDLRDAKLLVTTLQTFAVKAKPDMCEYGLVLFEESDQLFRQFARGGGGTYQFTSHVREHEAQEGFRVIHDAFRQSDYVFCYDATMSKVTETIARSFSDKPVRVIVNKETSAKAPVRMLDSKDMAYQVALDALGRGRRVVVACDTARTAHDMHEMALLSGTVKKDAALCITAKTEHDPRVVSFMTDVNAEADKYRLVTYNSAMGSGVSITEVQPDVLVQVSDYLTPRDNLQIINRYRRQNEVYVYYQTVEDLYAPDVETIRNQVAERIAYESGLAHVPLLERTTIATTRAEAAYLATADEMRQRRAPRDFYTGLLRSDGRKVHDGWSTTVSETVKGLRNEVNAIRKDQAVQIGKEWREFEPIDFAHPAPAGANAFQVACGERHAEIDRSLLGNIPVEVLPEEINRVVEQFKSKTGMIYMLLKQEQTFALAERHFLDRKKAVTAIDNRVTRMKLGTMLFSLYHTLDEVLEPDVVEARVAEFKASFDPVLYDRVVNRAGQKFAQVYDTDDETGSYMAIAKIILSMFGLKQQSERADRVGGMWRKRYSITNADDMRTFLAWRHPEGIEPFSFEEMPLPAREELTEDEIEQALVLFQDEHPGTVAVIKQRVVGGEW